MVFALVFLALALVPGLQCVTVQTMDIPSVGTFPVNVNGEQVHIQTLPAFIFEDEPVAVPELRPELIPEVEAVVPEIISINPCDSCFEYINNLIGQLVDIDVPGIVPHPMPEVEVVEQPEARPIPIEYLRM